jgi:hypothetical protein
MNGKVYLGDSVYAEFDGMYLTLTTENGYGPTNTIHLEDNVAEDLVKTILKFFPHLAESKYLNLTAHQAVGPS